jgi:transcriptional regulator with XRE-family HTH domain
MSERKEHTTMLAVLYIGDKVRELRKRSLLTQQQLADRSGVGVNTIIRIERNQVEPHGRTIRKLADALGVEPSDLLED